MEEVINFLRLPQEPKEEIRAFITSLYYINWL